MADSKYGRLFTEEDVRRFVAEFTEGYMEESDGEDLDANLVRFEGTFLADEPLFLLRGQDVAAPDVIESDKERDYYTSALLVGARAEHLAAVERAAKEMRDWQVANPDRVKVPD